MKTKTDPALALEWSPSPPATEATEQPHVYGADPNAPGGVEWTIKFLEHRLALLTRIVTTNQAEIDVTLAELAKAKASRQEAA